MKTRILIGALSGWQYHDRREMCRSTWMKDGDDGDVQSLFLLGCPSAKQPEQMGLHALACPCPDDYESLPQKTWWFAKWALQRDDWDYLFKCDDDTYISIPRLLAYDLEGRDYVGAEWRPGVSYGSGGAGYFLSRRAAAIVAEHLEAYPTGPEDLHVGQVLRAAGIEFSIEPRLIPFSGLDKFPRPGNDSITGHHLESSLWAIAHAETRL